MTCIPQTPSSSDVTSPQVTKTGVQVPMITQICFVEVCKPNAPLSGDVYFDNTLYITSTLTAHSTTLQELYWLIMPRKWLSAVVTPSSIGCEEEKSEQQRSNKCRFFSVVCAMEEGFVSRGRGFQRSGS